MEIEDSDIIDFYIFEIFNVDMSDAVRSDTDGSAPTILTSVCVCSSARIANRNLQLEIILDVQAELQSQ